MGEGREREREVLRKNALRLWNEYHLLLKHSTLVPIHTLSKSVMGPLRPRWIEVLVLATWVSDPVEMEVICEVIYGIWRTMCEQAPEQRVSTANGFYLVLYLQSVLPGVREKAGREREAAH